MAVWETAIITTKGFALQSKLTSGTMLTLTRAVTGAGFVDPELLGSQTAVTDERQEMSFETESYPEEGKCAVPVKLSNSGVLTEYIAKQIGIMAMDPDEGEILYMIAQAKRPNEVGHPEQGTVVPAEKDVAGFAAEWTFYMKYGQADGVTVNVDPANTSSKEEVDTLIAKHDTSENPHDGVLAKQADFAEHTASQDNPHKVTAAQLGLGNVDNTADAVKNVAFASEAATARKVDYSVIVRFNGGSEEGTDMWTFNGSTSKSINITPDKIGAAKADHVQDMQHGGTGATDGAAGLANLLAAGPMILSAHQFGDELPPAGTPGRIFFKRLT